MSKRKQPGCKPSERKSRLQQGHSPVRFGFESKWERRWEVTEKERVARLRKLAAEDGYTFCKVRPGTPYLDGIAYYLAQNDIAMVVAKYVSLEAAEKHLGLPESQRWTLARVLAPNPGPPAGVGGE